MSPEKLEHTNSTAPVNLGSVDPTLNPALEPQVVLAEQAEQFGSEIEQTPVTDQYEFQRTKFSVDDVSFVFRGREELPSIPAADEKVITQVLTTDEPPVYTSAKDYNAWRKNQGQGASKGTDSGKQEVEFIASDTPLGIIDVALKLVETGHGKTEQQDRLQGLRAKLAKDEIDDEVLGLFDIIYTAGAVDLETGRVDNHGASSEAPMLAALALGGDDLAQEIINTKRRIVDAEDRKRLVNREGQSLKQPREPLSDSELELMADSHFIAVHTTPTAPKGINEQGDKGIFPTGEYELGEQIHYPRETIHWSLNHAVDSHMMGDFTGREVTIVDALDELARANGAPTVLYGVDTYFSSSPGEPLALSSQASIVELRDSDSDQPLIVQNGNDIQIRKGDMRPEDFLTLEEFFGYDEKDKEYGLEGIGKSRLAWDLFAYGGIYLNWQMVERIEGGEQHRAYEYLTEEERAKSERYLKPFKTAYELIKPGLPEEPGEKDYEEALGKLFEKIVTGEVDIAEHPEFHDEIIETVRIMAVNKLIEEKGGQVEKSGGQSQYMANEEFKNRERHVVSTIGLRSGLHDNNIESWMEEVFKSTRSQATSGNYEEGTLKFDWSKYDDSRLWQTMPSSSWQNRRHMVRSGMLSFTPKKAAKLTSDGMLSVPMDAM